MPKPPEQLEQAVETLKSGDKNGIAGAYESLQVAMLGKPGCLINDLPNKVDWADSVWNDFVALLTHENNHVRSIAGQMVANLAQSMKPGAVSKDLDKLEAVTHDEKFVTARHVLQSIWKVGLGDSKLRKDLIERLAGRFKNCSDEKNSTLIRYDILVGLRSLFDATSDMAAKETALSLIPLEKDENVPEKIHGSVARSRITSCEPDKLSCHGYTWIN